MEDFEAIVEKYKKLVFNVIHNTAGWLNETEDIAQEVFIKVYKHLKGFRREADIKTWIYRIAVTTAIDYLRRAGRHEAVSLDEALVEPTKPEGEELIKNEEKQMVRQAISALPDKYRTVLILKEIESLSYREIANILKCRLGTVESRLFRARGLLRDRLKKYRGELR